MQISSISDIYAANDEVRDRIKDLLSRLSPDELSARPDGAKWSIAEIAEHVAVVEEGGSRICAKLLKKAESAGPASTAVGGKISAEFVSRWREIADVKVEAPEIVQPTGKMSIEEAVAKMDANGKRLEEIRPLFEWLDSDSYKFRHPFLGDISAIEWLALIGGHGQRHLKQMENLIEKMRQ